MMFAASVCISNMHGMVSVRLDQDSSLASAGAAAGLITVVWLSYGQPQRSPLINREDRGQ
jgi:hypothetical protein